MATHKWFLEIDREAKDQFDELDNKTRKNVFPKLQKLLEAENPLSLPSVKKIVNSENLYRIRQGNYRIFFSLEVGEVERNKHTYKGILRITRVSDRKEAY